MQSVSPLLLSFQQLPVGGDLYIQGQLDIHEFLVLSQLASHIMLSSLQSQLQVPYASLGIFYGGLPARLRCGYLVLNSGTLIMRKKQQQKDKWCKLQN